MNPYLYRSLVSIALTFALTGCIHEETVVTQKPTPEVTPPTDPNITPPSVDTYTQVVTNWTFPLLLSEQDRNDPLYQDILDKRFNNATVLLDTLVIPTKTSSAFLWEKYPLFNEDGSVHNKNMAATFNHIKSLALGYRTFDSMHNDDMRQAITDALTFMLEHLYFDGVTSTGNWYEWEIAVPKTLYDILSLMHNELPLDMITKANNATRFIIPDPNWQHKGEGATREPMESAGANRVDLAMVVLMRGVFDKNDKDIQSAINAVPTVLDEVTTGNGFYEDGSFLQHANIPYIGTYGLTLLQGIAKIVDGVKGTNIDISDERYLLINRYLMHSLAPFMYEAKMMDAVNGRAIARGWVQNSGEGVNAVTTLIRFYESRQGEEKQQLGQLIKHHLLSNKEAFFQSTSDLYVLYIADQILSDDTIQPKNPLKTNYVFYNQDRMVHRGDHFAFTVSLHSDRIGNYECLTTTNENLKGWYTGDGMTYLYDADHLQYKDWYALVDKRYLAGTTTDGKALPDCGGRRQYNNTKKDMTFVGGVSNDDYGIYGADFYNHNNSLQAKKSYFAIENKIVALGSNITSKTNTAFTTIANQKLNEKGDNAINYDGTSWQPTGDETKVAKQYFHVEGNTNGSQLGVYLPTGNSVKMKYHYRQGNWSVLYPENDNNMDLTSVEGYVLRSYIEQNEQQDQYAYVLLPTLSAQETKEYANNADIVVVKQDQNMHAIFDHTHEVFAAFSWTDAETSTPYINTVGKLSILTQLKGEQLHIWLSQPDRTNKPIQFKFNQWRNLALIQDKEERVSLIDNYWQVDTQDLNGSAYHVIFHLG